MFLHQSNRLEILLHQMRDVLRDPLPDPLTPEIIVVHNPGMAQWLAQQLAFADGIAAHCRFPLPARFAWDLVRRLGAVLPEEDAFRKPVLRWRIAGLLPSLLTRPGFRDLAVYLRDDGDGGKLDQLADKIADVFDQYMVYRPDLLDRWQQGRDDHWQAALWRTLTADAVPHRARLAEYFRQLPPDAGSAGLAPDALPRRCHLFGLNSLAPVHLEIIARISRLTEVHLFHLSPCRHYWGDLVSARRLAGQRARNRGELLFDAYVDQGHPLLASSGKVGQDFFRQLLDGDPQEIDLYRENAASHALAVLQNDILDLNDRSLAGADRHPLDPEDCSLQFHCCCSRLREVQVLHDRLLDLFQQYPGLSPGDILVSAPDIQEYADAVVGVFGEAGGERRIPWSLADQPLAGEHPLIRCLLDLLDLLPGRFTAPEVLSLCETPALLRRFGLDPAILPRLHDWVRETGIRWGLDADHREEFAIHAGDLHSWRFGMDRLLLGYLMGDCREPQAGRLPYGHLAGGENEALGGFLALIEALAGWRLRLRRDRPMAEWCDGLMDLIDDLFAAEEDDQGVRMLREAVSGLKADCRQAAFAAPVTFAVLKRHLRAILSLPTGGQPFLSGRVTFCNMVPMRSVPFRVVCLLGMNDQSFPRGRHPLAFDLMAAEPRLGDRNRSQDDRYLFVEALLSARDVFYLSWIGRNQRDDAIAPPSVVVAELRDYLDQSCLAAKASVPVSAHLTTVHPMQPFSRRCFDGTRATAGYNPAWLPAAEATGAPPFLAGAPVPPPDDWRTVDADDLVRFWRHPARFFLERMLGLRLRDTTTDIAASEPFALDRLDQYLLRRATVTGLLAGMPAEQIYRGMETSGVLPPGGFGRTEFAAIAAAGAPFADQLRPLLAHPLEPVAIDQAIGPFRLTGRLTDCFPVGRVTWRPAALRGADLITLWVRHLILNLQAPAGLLPVSVYLARDPADNPVQRLVLRPVADAAGHLRALLDWYWQGLSAPLPFFPETSLAWAEALNQEKDPYEAARPIWEGGYNRDGEGSDPACRLCFPWEHFTATPDFIALAALYDPILTHLEDDGAAA